MVCGAHVVVWSCGARGVVRRGEARQGEARCCVVWCGVACGEVRLVDGCGGDKREDVMDLAHRNPTSSLCTVRSCSGTVPAASASTIRPPREMKLTGSCGDEW
jgi:hypothetical protein